VNSRPDKTTQQDTSIKTKQKISNKNKKQNQMLVACAYNLGYSGSRNREDHG
jgi:hypothetical protein